MKTVPFALILALVPAAPLLAASIQFTCHITASGATPASCVDEISLADPASGQTYTQVLLPLFDPALGTLTGVQLTSGVGVSVYEMDTNGNIVAAPSLSAEGLNVILNLLAFDESEPVLPSLGVPQVDPYSFQLLKTTGGLFIGSDGYIRQSQSVTYQASDLSVFQGSGDFSFIMQSLVNVENWPYGDLANTIQADVDSNYTLRYDYTPAGSSVPEPATLGMIGAGLALLVTARRLLPFLP